MKLKLKNLAEIIGWDKIALEILHGKNVRGISIEEVCDELDPISTVVNYFICLLSIFLDSSEDVIY